jgi:glycerol-3-phosphate dehydrogenase
MSALDLLVIGGGVNGAGAFRDAALRGIRCAVVEKEDWGAGTTGASSGMIHGGARYLLDQPKVTRLSCRDSGRIQRIVPHLLFRIPFLFPVPSDKKAAKLLLAGMDGFFEAYDRYQPLKRGLRHERLTRDQALALEPGLRPDIAGAITFDEWGIDTQRLCWLNVRSGIEAGGKAFPHVRVASIERAGEDGWRVRGRGTLDGAAWEATARCLLNAAGPWGPAVAGLAGAEVRLRPSKGVHLVLDRRVTNFSITAGALDGRSIFLEPWQNVTLLGTTDDDYFGDPDDVRVTNDDVEYLRESIASVYPSIRDCRLIDTWVGVRPTLHEYGKYEDDLTREHAVIDHGGEAEPKPGLFTLTGGKLASYRAMAQDAIDAVARRLGNDASCRTADEALPGGDAPADEAALAERTGLPRQAVRRIAYRHGSLAAAVLAPCETHPSWRRPVCRCEPVTEAEIRWAAREEGAVTLGDVMRRTRLGTGPCGGIRCAFPAALVLADALGASASWAREETRRFLELRYRSRRPIADGAQFRMEAIVRRAARAYDRR